MSHGQGQVNVFDSTVSKLAHWDEIKLKNWFVCDYYDPIIT
jgi:hypothetical protein